MMSSMTDVRMVARNVSVATGEGEEETGVVVAVPDLGDVRTVVTVTIAHKSTPEKAASFAFTYTPPTDPAIVSTFPTDGTTLGGDIVTFSLKNTPLADAQSATVAFGGVAATAVSAAEVNGVVFSSAGRADDLTLARVSLSSLP